MTTNVKSDTAMHNVRYYEDVSFIKSSFTRIMKIKTYLHVQMLSDIYLHGQVLGYGPFIHSYLWSSRGLNHESILISFTVYLDPRAQRVWVDTKSYQGLYIYFWSLNDQGNHFLIESDQKSKALSGQPRK